jgi:hypothetical protein
VCRVGDPHLDLKILFLMIVFTFPGQSSADSQMLVRTAALHDATADRPLTVWFWAAYLMVTDKRGISALWLQRHLGLRRCETAWMLLHKLRRAMVNTARERLHGEVEIDDTWVGGEQPGIRGSRQLKGRKTAIVLVAVEKRARARITSRPARPSTPTA